MYVYTYWKFLLRVFTGGSLLISFETTALEHPSAKVLTCDSVYFYHLQNYWYCCTKEENEVQRQLSSSSKVTTYINGLADTRILDFKFSV